MTGLGIGLWAAITIAVAGPATSTEYLPLQVAQAEGYFTQEKLEVALSVERNEGEAARALTRGRADLAAPALDARYRERPVEGAPTPTFFVLNAAAPVAILVSPSHGHPSHGCSTARPASGHSGREGRRTGHAQQVLIHAGVKIQVPSGASAAAPSRAPSHGARWRRESWPIR